MSRPSTSYGRFASPEPPSALMRLHFHRGETLHEVDHEPKIGVLDQEDLFAQGIRVSQFIPGARDVDALGSCTANATIAALSNLLPPLTFANYVSPFTGRGQGGMGGAAEVSEVGDVYADVVSAEKAAIRFYHYETDETGDPSTEWPPTDCGGSGPLIVMALRQLGLASGDRIAHGAQNLVSLMQTSGVLAGIPFLNAWEAPNGQGFVDGDGSLAALDRQLRLGIAGGHEIFLSAVEKLALTETGAVIPEQTVIRFRNSWSATWGDHGSGRFHLSTLVALGSAADFRTLVP